MGVEAGATVARDDAALVDALRRGDEAAFETLLTRYHPALVRGALLYVRDREVAEEVAQETWLAMLQGVARFEGRSTVKTWLFSILVHRAKARAQRERPSVPLSVLVASEFEAEHAGDPTEFEPPGSRWAGHWRSFPQEWRDIPEGRLLSGELRARLHAAIDELPPAQQAVVTLRDVDGLSAKEVCNLLGLSETNQRVLLHRGRTKVRRALAGYFAEE